MTFCRIAGSLVVAVGLAGGVFAVPAQADTAYPPDDNSTSVSDFLNSLNKLGITNIDPAKAMQVSQSVCPLLAERGQNTADVASTVADAIGRPLGAATMFTGTAISILCPRAVENVTNDLTNGKPLLPLLGN